VLFNSVDFYLFFPVVTIGYFALPHRARWVWLLLASCWFYMAFVPAYILILAGTILIDYTAGLAIERATGPRRRLFLIASIVANVGVLAVFKYLGFLNANVAALAHLIGWNYPLGPLHLLLPIGLSFHTFQSMAYTIEVYRGHQPAERHLGILALYVLFYPQLVAGPIERPQHLLHQFHEQKRADPQDIGAGLRLMAWGFFKKVVIADRLAHLVNPVYSDPASFSGPMLLAATVAFSYQIYCDFSGYSDIAIGAARVMGFRLMTNFDRPYHARSIGEFWRRWHISLSSWFRDYVYIPLGGNRTTRPRLYVNVMLTFLVSGLWHGASWAFVVWGALHGAYLVAGLATAAPRQRLAARVEGAVGPWPLQAWRIGCTFALVTLAWVFFRANTLGDAWYVVQHMFTGYGAALASVGDALRTTLGAPGPMAIAFPAKGAQLTLLVAIVQVVLLEVLETLGHHGWLQRFDRWPTGVRLAGYYAFTLNVLLFGVFEQSSFIYFQF
jgi:D-alanyl-lipoteichoic acid acyltransferase DltB (MBOAT superfamily)